MISGDHIKTATKIALECGILDQKELGQPMTVMDGAEFRKRMGGFKKVMDPEKKCE